MICKIGYMMGKKKTCLLNVYTEISSIIHSSTGHREKY